MRLVKPPSVRVLGQPLPVPGKGRSTDLIVVLDAAYVEVEQPGPPRRVSIEPQCWVERVSSAGKSIWSYAIDRRWYLPVTQPGPSIGLAQLGKRQVLVLVAGSRLIGLDPATGKELWPPLDLGGRPTRPAVLADLDGDGNTDVLVVTNLGDLVAFSIIGRRALWSRPLPPGALSRLEQSDSLAVTPPGSDGSQDVLLAGTGEWSPTNGWISVERLRGRDGELLWQARFLKNIHSRPIAPNAVWRLIPGPDLDGDGQADVFVACIPPTGAQSVCSGGLRPVGPRWPNALVAPRRPARREWHSGAAALVAWWSRRLAATRGGENGVVFRPSPRNVALQRRPPGAGWRQRSAVPSGRRHEPGGSGRSRR
jgi:hypothetical protein